MGNAQEKSTSLWKVGAICIALGAIATWPLIRFPLHLPADSTTDTFLFSWSFWWLKDSIVNLHSPFYSTTLFYPEKANLAMATLSLPYGIFYVLLSWLPGDIAVPLSFFLVIQFSFAASGIAMFLFCRELGFSNRAALYSGIFLTISTIHLENITRLHLGCIEMPVGALLALLRLLKSQTMRESLLNGVFLGVMLTLLVLSSQTYSLHFILIGNILILAYLIRHRELFRQPWTYAGAGLAGLTFVILSLPYLIALKEFADAYPFLPLGTLDPDVTRPFRPGIHQTTFKALFPWWTMPVHNHIFPGLLIYIFALIGFFKFQSSVLARWSFGLIGLIGIVFFAGTHLNWAGHPTGITLPYHYFKQVVPILQADRAPDRYFFLTLVFLCLMAGCGVDFIFSRFGISASRLRYVAILFPALIGIENHWNANQFQKPSLVFPQTLERAAKAKPGAVVMGLPPDLDSKHTFFLQVRTGAAIVDADYPRLSPILRYAPLRNAGLLELFMEPGRIRGYSVEQQSATCAKIRDTLRANRVETIYVIDDVYKAGYQNRIAETRELLTMCGWNRIDKGDPPSFILASVWEPDPMRRF
ncbi:MAG: hypothetical protein JNM27_00330 [Leptospirales bacterium]|nr:hypothetical protein [Leptospirales bacterium]